MRTMQGLTDRQQQVLKYIKDSITDRGYPPTLREIGAHMGIRSTNGVNDHLRALERKGYLTREDIKSRALRPTAHANSNTDPNASGVNGIERDGVTGLSSLPPLSDDDDVIDVQVLGRVAAGLPLFAEE